MEKRYQVFVSSTYADLKDERQKVIQTLMEMDCIPSGMELFPAIDDEQWEFIKKIINDCDYYLLIIGGRYGSISPEGVSYTEKEFDYAIEKGIKIIALVHEDPDSIATGKTDKNPDLADKLKQFRIKVQDGRLVKYWKEAKDISGIVALSLQKTIKIHPAIGWVRADKISNEELLIEINELRKENAELKAALSETEPSIFTKSEEKDFSYIYGKLNRLERIELIIRQQKEPFNEHKEYLINLASLISFISKAGVPEYDWKIISFVIINEIYPERITQPIDNSKEFSITEIEKIVDELVIYGFLTKNHNPSVSSNSILRNKMQRRKSQWLGYSEKLERYKYWLDVTGKIPEHIEILKNK